MGKENMVYIHDGILRSHKEEGNYVICRKKDRSRDHQEKIPLVLVLVIVAIGEAETCQPFGFSLAVEYFQKTQEATIHPHHFLSKL
jgi:hypothetical protein